MDQSLAQGSDPASSHVAATAPLRSPSPLTLTSDIVPAFAPEKIATEFNASFSPPASPMASRGLFAAISSGEDFFALVAERGLEFRSRLEAHGEDTRGYVDVAQCVDRNRRTLLHQACRCGNVQVAKCLLFHGANTAAKCRKGRTPFHEATMSAEKTALQLLKLLYDHGPSGLSLVDSNGAHVVHLAAIQGNLAVIRWCVELEAPQLTTVNSPRPHMSKYVVPLGATSNSGRNVLHYAAYNGRLEALQWLLGDGNVRHDELNLAALDANGYSVLHYAAMGAPLEVCEWLVLEAPMRHRLNLTAQTSEGKTAVDLASARPGAIRHFLSEIVQVPGVPSGLRCLGADTTSLGVAWDIEPTSSDTRLWEVLRPLYFHLEVCKKPPSLSSASGFLTMLMLMPPTTPTSPRATKLASSAMLSASYLLNWEPLGVLLLPEAREHWLCGLEKDTEYLVRIRARNRNGFSGYSSPNLSGVFTTGDGGRRRIRSTLEQFFGAIQTGLPMEPIATTFIGDLHFELLETRNLPGVRAKSASVYKNLSAPQGRYYCAVSVETPSESRSSRLLYSVRSSLATLQQDLVQSGSSQVWRHPRFALNTVFRVPEAMAETQVTITVHHETLGESESYCVGRLSLSLLDLVQGMPAKMQWMALFNTVDAHEAGGLVLLRTLFLADGITELPHPSLPNTWGSTAEELLATTQAPLSSKGDDHSSPPSSSSSTCSTSSTSSQFAHSSMLSDRFGFSIFDPEVQLRNGEWQGVKLPSGTTRSYGYYQLLAQAIEQQQELQWQRLRCTLHADNSHTLPSYFESGSNQPESNASGGADGHDVCDFDSKQRRIVRELVWRGIPASRRPELYSLLSGASALRKSYSQDYFFSLIERLEDPTDGVHFKAKYARFASAKRQIHVDLKRTFAGNDDCWISSQEGQRSLERVLLAYALHNDALGYCQSMTFVVGRLLCLFHAQASKAKSDKVVVDFRSTTEDEQRTFWLLLVICEVFFPSYFTSGMTGLQVDGAVLDKLIEMRLPKLHRHFQQMQAPPMGLVLVTQWLLPLCCAVFPSETSFRLLDAIFYEGSSVVFAIAIALLRISQHDLLAERVDYTQLFRFLRARDQRLHDAPLLMEVAYEEHQAVVAQIGPLRHRVAKELGFDTEQDDKQMHSTPAANEIRPGEAETRTQTEVTGS